MSLSRGALIGAAVGATAVALVLLGYGPIVVVLAFFAVTYYGLSHFN